MALWLFKSEPGSYSIDDLARDKREWWDGVRNWQARNFMRDDMQIGDGVLFYHSSCAVPAVVGEAKVSDKATPDKTQFDPKSPYFDPRATPQSPRWWHVQIAFVKKFPRPVPLHALRAEERLAAMRILQRGNRLSITPLSPGEWRRIREMATE